MAADRGGRSLGAWVGCPGKLVRHRWPDRWRANPVSRRSASRRIDARDGGTSERVELTARTHRWATAAGNESGRCAGGVCHRGRRRAGRAADVSPSRDCSPARADQPGPSMVRDRRNPVATARVSRCIGAAPVVHHRSPPPAPADDRYACAMCSKSHSLPQLRCGSVDTSAPPGLNLVPTRIAWRKQAPPITGRRSSAPCT
jgi:hypothetical protein